MYTFTFPTTMKFGAGVIKELGGHLGEINCNKPLIVTDGVIVNLDFFKKIVAELNSQGVYPEVFNEMHKNPVKSDVIKGTKKFNEAGCDAVIGIGGGVAMDVARAIVLKVHHHEDLFHYDDLIGGDKYVTGSVPYFVTVPTTSGTGSEVGRSAIISDDVTHQKKILFSPKLLARIVFLDPELTLALPSFITAATGMDALTHNMEAYLAKNYHPMCDGIAIEGIRLICNAIEKATHEGDNVQARSDMMLGSAMGAIAFQKGLGVVHSLAHPMSSLLDTHHGLANAINLPYGMKFNYKGFEDKFERMAQVMGLDNGEAIVPFLFELNSRLGLPTKLRDVGVKESHIEELSDLALADFCHPNNPKPVSREDFKQLYMDAL